MENLELEYSPDSDYEPESQRLPLDRRASLQRNRRRNQTEQARQRRRDQDRERRRRIREASPETIRAAVDGNGHAPTPHNLGEMTKVCDHCDGLHFIEERAKLMNSCCHHGKALAPPLSEYPDALKELLTGDHEEAKNFREFIRQYNTAHAFASFGAKIENLPPGRGPYCFKISGEVYHLATSALVRNDPNGDRTPPRYAQIYIYDSDAAVQFRMHVRQNDGCHATIMLIIDQEMRRISPYVDQYRNLHAAAENAQAVARAEGVNQVNYELRLIRNLRNADPRRYNVPVTNKECMFLIETGDGEIRDLDLAVHPIDQRGCVRITSTSRHIDRMVFPLFFPHGDSGWCVNALNAVQNNKRITPLQFYSSRIAVRGSFSLTNGTRVNFNPIHHGGKLFQQYLVHAYCRVEEIIACLEPYQDRPDMAARVFMVKVDHFINLMKTQYILGKVIAFVYVIEFQKRGLPHVHSLFWMDKEDHLVSGDDVDRVISAEIPNQDHDPDLYNIVMRNNIHGPCGVHSVNCEPTCRNHNPASPCMENDVCKKRFPKPFQLPGHQWRINWTRTLIKAIVIKVNVIITIKMKCMTSQMDHTN